MDDLSSTRTSCDFFFQKWIRDQKWLCCLSGHTGFKQSSHVEGFVLSYFWYSATAYNSYYKHHIILNNYLLIKRYFWWWSLNMMSMYFTTEPSTLPNVLCFEKEILPCSLHWLNLRSSCPSLLTARIMMSLHYSAPLFL